MLPPMPKGPDRRDARLTLRLPPTLRASIQRWADEDRRTASDWIVFALEAAVAARERKAAEVERRAKSKGAS